MTPKPDPAKPAKGPARQGVAGEDTAAEPEPQLCVVQSAAPSDPAILNTGSSPSPDLLRRVAHLLQQLADTQLWKQQGSQHQHSWFREDVERLLSLELEVIRLQQALQFLRLEFDSRTAQADALALRLRASESQAGAAEERACRLADAVQRLEAECRALEGSREKALAQLRQAQTRVKQLEGERGKGAQQTQQQQQQQGDSCNTDLRQHLQKLRQENKQLKSQINAACGNLKALGIPASQVFSRSAVAQAQLASPPDSPRSSLPPQPTHRSLPSQTSSQPGTARHHQRPPAVPRLPLAAAGLGPLVQQPAQQPTQQPPSQPARTQLQQGEGVRQPQGAWQCSGGAEQTDGACHAAQAGCNAGDKGRPGGQAVPERRQGAACNLPQVASTAADQRSELGLVYGVQQSQLSVGSSRGAVGQETVLQAAVARLAAESVAPQPQQQPQGTPGMDVSCMAQIEGPHQDPAKAALGPLHLRHSRGAGLMVSSAAPAAEEAIERHLLLSEANSAAEDGGDSGGMIGAWRPPELQQSYAALHGHPLSRRGSVSNAESYAPLKKKLGLTPRMHSGAAKQCQQQRITYAHLSEFQEVMEAYHAVMASEGDKAARWASKLSSKSAIETHPHKVEPLMQGLIQLFEESGVPLPLRHTGPCQYTLAGASGSHGGSSGAGGGAKCVVRLVNGRLMVRSGSSNVDVLAWLAKQPVPRPL
ncbi:hypothetical protein N2152v2_001370 [Parachlorella kessleri]